MYEISPIRKNDSYIELLDKIIYILVVMIILVGIITALFLIQFIDHYLFDNVYASSNIELAVPSVLALEY
jgi:nitrate reductase gamma subunit